MYVRDIAIFIVIYMICVLFILIRYIGLEMYFTLLFIIKMFISQIVKIYYIDIHMVCFYFLNLQC